MINLFYGGGISSVRRELFDNLTAGTLVVVPDELSKGSFAEEAAKAWCAASLRVMGFDEFVTLIARSGSAWPQVVAPDNICRAILRNLIEVSPKDFDQIVGRYSVPRMSQGVLTRIFAAFESLANTVEVEDSPTADSPRRQQMRQLLRRFEERLSEAGVQREKLALWQGIIELSAEAWQKSFGDIDRVVFVDFDGFRDEVYLAIMATSKQVAQCDVLLEFDPENDFHGGSRLEAAFQRLYDMADHYIDTSRGESTKGAAKDVADTRPVIVTAESMSAEMAGIAGAISKLVRDGAEPSSIVVALPDAQTYASGLERSLQDHGISWQWLAPQEVDRGGEFLLLERLRRCAGHFVTGAAVADLFRAPGFGSMVTPQVPTVEAWNLASRLDYVLSLTGKLTGWKAIEKRVQRALNNLHTQRERGKLSTEEELATDGRLVDLLGHVRGALEPFSAEKSVAQWAGLTAELLGNGPFVQVGEKAAERMEILQKILANLADAGSAVAPGDVSFSYFVTLLRAASHGVQTEVSFDLRRGEIVLADVEEASKIAGEYCLLAGFNDGRFPRFSKPDASFMGYNSQPDQRPARARQWHQLERLLSRFDHVWLWMPERQGTEELLPSQFAEALLRTEAATGIDGKAFLDKLACTGSAPIDVAEVEMAAGLQNVRMSGAELAKFRKYGMPVYNAARAISVMAERNNAELGGYDGILKDPILLDWIEKWLDRHKFSVSQLDGVVGCSFRFFADRILNLDEIEEADDLLPATVFGSFTHDVLARFYRSWVAAGRGVLSRADEALAREELQRAYYAEYDPAEDLSEFACDLMNLKLFGELGPKRFGEAKPRLEEVADVGVFGTFLLMEMQRGEEGGEDFLQPSNFEVGFGVSPEDEEDPLSTPECIVMDIGKGESVKLWGRIDRIDVSDKGVFAVTDYKTGHLPTGTEIAGGFRTQLPVYMLVAQELLKKQYEAPDPAGGLYYSLRRGKAAKVSGVFVRSAYQDQVGVGGRCMKDEQFLETLAMVKDRIRHSMTALRRGYLTTTRHNPDTVCRFCAFQRLCYRDVERTAAFWEAIEKSEELMNQNAEVCVEE